MNILPFHARLKTKIAKAQMHDLYECLRLSHKFKVNQTFFSSISVLMNMGKKLFSLFSMFKI